MPSLAGIRRIQITDRSSVPDAELLARIERAPRPMIIQVRDKDLPPEARRQLAERVLGVARRRGHLVMLNGDVELAAALHLDGVHLPSNNHRGADAIARVRGAFRGPVIVTTAGHTIEDVDDAARTGVDAVLLSPIFRSPSKGAPIGVEALARASVSLDRAGSACLLFALGGIDETTATHCLEAGAYGVAAIRADLGRWQLLDEQERAGRSKADRRDE